MTKIKEPIRKVWSFPWFEQFFADLRFGIRALWNHPAFAIVAVLTLALGIGANTAIFSVVEGVVLAALPYPKPDRLVMVLQSRPSLKQVGISYPDFEDWQRGARSFERMAALMSRSYDLTAPGTSEHLAGMEVSSGFFATLGVMPVLGDEFSPSEDRPNEARTVVISDRLWKDRFASNPGALGRTIASTERTTPSSEFSLRNFACGTTWMCIRRWRRVSLCFITIAPSTRSSAIGHLKPGVRHGSGAGRNRRVASKPRPALPCRGPKPRDQYRTAQAIDRRRRRFNTPVATRSGRDRSADRQYECREPLAGALGSEDARVCHSFCLGLGAVCA